MQCLILCALVSKLSLSLSALVLYLVRLSGALLLKFILANVLLPSEHDSDKRKHEGDYQQL